MKNGVAPLDVLFDLGECFVNELADVSEDGLREGRGGGDVLVYFG